MLRIRLRQQARSDLRNIWLYSLEIFGRQVAADYYNSLLDTIDAARLNPSIGKQVSIMPGVLALHSGRHFVFYRILDTRLVVIRILQEKQDFKRHL